MNKINSVLRTRLVLAFLLTAFLIAGIPFIILGATQGKTVMLVTGIIMTVVGFYGCPIGWTTYGNSVVYRRVVSAITCEHLLTVPKIASSIGKSEQDTDTLVINCFQNGYLTGYLKNGYEILVNEEKDPDKKMVTYKCAFCGATYTIPYSEIPVCPYCGRAEKKNR